ncbi:MAG: hypothetical protein F4X11_15420 [Acidobacteria bacterium]|nr:hypothetical protein [Acidobacteriota bacterium]
MTIEVLTIILTGVSVTAGVLLGVWRMLAHYESRNDAAHAELGRRIDGARVELGARIDEMGKRIDLVNGRIDLVYQELVKSRI